MRPSFRGYFWGEPEFDGLAICNAVEYRQRWPDRVKRVVHPCWGIDYSFEGGIRYRVKYPRRPWKERAAGVAHVYPPRVEYWEDGTQIRGLLHGAYVQFTGGESAGLDKLVDKKFGYARIIDSAGSLAGLFHEIAEVGQTHERAGFWKAQAILCRMIDILLPARKERDNTYRIGRSDGLPSQSEMVRKARDYIEGHLHETISLDDLARHASVSLSTLSHKYRNETGETPMATHVRLQVDQAKGMVLLGAGLKVIAERLGFCDVYHLSRTFKKVSGLSPRAFRRSLDRMASGSDSMK